MTANIVCWKDVDGILCASSQRACKLCAVTISLDRIEVPRYNEYDELSKYQNDSHGGIAAYIPCIYALPQAMRRPRSQNGHEQKTREFYPMCDNLLMLVMSAICEIGHAENL